MDATALQWWTAQQAACPRCGGTSVPILLDMQDAESREAVRTGLAALAGCGLGGNAYDHECRKCGWRWSTTPSTEDGCG